MNLTSIHLAELVALLHEVLSEQEAVTSGTSRKAVEYRGRLFAVGDAPASVAGPYRDLFELIESLGTPVGEKKDAEHPPLWFWDGRNFDLDHAERRVVRRPSKVVIAPPSDLTDQLLGGRRFMFGVERGE
jgi:hypothetical protein